MSLRDEMLKAGLITPQQAKQSQHKRRVDRKEKGKEALEREARSSKEQAARQRAEAQERDRAQGAQRAAAQQQQAQTASKRQKEESALQKAFAEGELSNWEGQRGYHYVRGTLIDAVQVSEETQRRLEQGQAGIVAGMPGRKQPTIVSAAAVRTLRSLAPEQVLCFHGQG